MQDGVLNDTGNGYLVKGGSSFPATYAEFLTQVKAGTLPLDILFNAAGWNVQGTPLSKANLLDDTVAAALKTMAGLSSNPATPNAALSAIVSAVSAGAKIATGSYTGTGTYGSSNPCSLTFDFVPKIVLIVCNYKLSSQNYWRGGPSGFGIFFPQLLFTEQYWYQAYSYNLQIDQSGYCYAKRNSQTLLWYNSNSYTEQLNAADYTYTYYAVS